MLETCIKLIREAGQLVKEIKCLDSGLKIETKKDGSKVSTGDKASEAFLLDAIYKNFGRNELIISEEEVADGKILDPGNRAFWLIDPIDGTKSYIENKNDYCINLSYMENNQPTLGIIYAPELNTLWYATKGKGAFKVIGDRSPEPIKAREIPKEATAVVSMKGHQLTPEIFARFNLTQEIIVRSAIKFCYIAEGKADYYFRKRNHAADWDISPGDIIIKEAGGEFLIDQAQNYKYGKPPYLAPDLIAKGKGKSELIPKNYA